MSSKRASRWDSDVDPARIIYWFRCLGDHIGTHLPREIQRVIAPKTIHDSPKDEPIKNSKFLGYSRGEHVPQAALVERGEYSAPRSSRALNHPLWLVLRRKGSVAKVAANWIRQLDPDIQWIVLGPHMKVPLGASRHTLGSLERRASIDSLAALTIMLRLSHEQGQEEWSWLYAQTIFRVLLMIGSHLDHRTVAERVFQIYVQRVFSLVTFNGHRMALEKYNYPVMSALLDELADRARDERESERDRKMPSFYALQVLNGYRGLQFKQLFEIPQTPKMVTTAFGDS